MIDLVILLVLSILFVASVYVAFMMDREDRMYIYNNFNSQKDQRTTTLIRGTDSERNIVNMLIEGGIDPELIFHDLYIAISPEEYAQIDIVVLTKVGIIVIEDKDFSGWIFGKGTQLKWTQVLAYGKIKNQFYNPVLQNIGHIKALSQELTGIVEVPFYSIISFSRKCTLRNVSNIPTGTYVCYSNQIRSIIDEIIKNNPPTSYVDNDQLTVLLNLLNSFVSNGANPRIIQLHQEYIRRKILGAKNDYYRKFYESI